MAQGLQVFGADGKLVLDLTKRFAKLIGQKTATGSGEITADSLNAPNNKLWYFIVSSSESDVEEIKPLLRISADGKKIFWKNIEIAISFFYGVY